MNDKELKALELQLETEKRSNKIIEHFANKTYDTEFARTKGQVDVLKAVAANNLNLDGNLLITNRNEDSHKQNFSANNEQTEIGTEKSDEKKDESGNNKHEE